MSFIGNQWGSQVTQLGSLVAASSCANGFPTINASGTGMTANSNVDSLQVRTEGFLVTTDTNLRTLTIAATSDLTVSQNTARVGANTWTLRDGRGPWENITWSPELGIFVAVSTTDSATSPDGIHWTGRGAIGANSETRAVTWSPELGIFVAVRTSGGSRAASSPDGITWTSRTTPANNEVSAVIWVKELGLFVASANGAVDSGNDSTRLIMTSPDGVIWTGRVTPNTTFCRDIAWSKEFGLVVATDAGTVITSLDGITWARSNTNSSSEHYSVAWSPTLKIFVSVGAVVRSSPDGITWTGRSFPTSVSVLNKVLWVPQMEAFVALSVSGTYRGAISFNGTSWRSLPGVPSTVAFQSFAWSPELGIFVGVTSTVDSSVYTSRPVGLWGAIQARLSRSQVMTRISLGV